MTAFRFSRRTNRIGRRIYVAPPTASPAGNDTTGTGTRTSPYATIAKASTVVTPGTTVFVAPGTYGSVYMMASTGGGTASAPVTYQSSQRWGAKIVAPGSDSAWYVGDQVSNHPDHIRIIGFEVTAPTAPNGFIIDANHVWIIDCHVYNVGNHNDSSGGGINIEGFFGGSYQGTGNRVIGNWVHHIGRSTNTLRHPIYVGSPQTVVQNNVCYDTGGWGIHCYHGPNGSSVINNTVFDCVGAGGIVFGGGDSTPGEPITTSGTVNNNIIRDCTWGINENGSASGIVYRDNWVLDCTNNINADVDANDAGTTVIDVDPGMVDYQSDGAGDYHLASTSTASPTGTQTASPGEDFDRIGRLRPPGIGAFRTIESTGPPPGPGSALPTKVAGVYWPQWETVRLTAMPAAVNSFFLSFAINNGSDGSVRWDGMYGGIDQEVFEDDIQQVREAGKCCILSVGGEFIELHIDNAGEVTNFVNSIKALYDNWGGFDGIDWDIEGGWITGGNRQYHEAASRELKDFYGADFAISMSYQGPDEVYKAMASELESTGDLDWASIQYYDYSGPQTSDVQSRISEMVNTWGVDPSHLGIGVKYEPGNGNAWQTTAGLISMWNTLEATYPTIRGCVNWSSELDRNEGGGFATTVAPVITS